MSRTVNGEFVLLQQSDSPLFFTLTNKNLKLAVETLVYLWSFIDSFAKGRSMDRKRLCDTDSEEFKQFGEKWALLRKVHAWMVTDTYAYIFLVDENGERHMIDFLDALNIAYSTMERTYTVDGMIHQIHKGSSSAVMHLAAYEGVRRIDINLIYQSIVERVNLECGDVWAKQFEKEMRTFNML